MNLLEIRQGHCIDQLRQMPKDSVHCVVTSPPYWNLRDYKIPPVEWPEMVFTPMSICEQKIVPAWTGQLGLEPTPEMFVAHIVAVFREVWRVLRPDGTMFLNFGDSYFGSKSSGDQNAISCDISGKALGDFPKSDCFCQNLCGVCREVYRHTTHTSRLLEAMLLASLHGTNHEHKALKFVRLPTSDSLSQEARKPIANKDQIETECHESAPLRAFLESMIWQLTPQLLDVCLQRDNRGECLLCARSLERNARQCEDRISCPCAIRKASDVRQDQTSHRLYSEATGDALVSSKEDKVSDSFSYQNSTKALRLGQLKPKDLIGIPWRVALALQADGWFLRSDIIWSKANPMPSSVTDRPGTSHEYIFLLTKRAHYFFDMESIKEPASSATNPRRSNNGQTPVQGWASGSGSHSTIDYAQKKVGSKRKFGDHGIKNNASFDEAMAVMPSTRNKRSVWTLPSQAYSESHFATFPPDLIRPCILAGTSQGGCCGACGKPLERVTKRTDTVDPSHKGSRFDQGKTGARDGGKRTQSGERFLKETVGWRSTCKCNNISGVVPCTVLDPFGGSGTVGEVSLEYGRHCVLIELGEQNIELIKGRTNVTPGML